jgi:hypothetical protein
VSLTGKYHSRMTTEEAPGLGDEAVSFRVTGSVSLPATKKGEPDRATDRIDRYVVVRVGSALVTFDMMKVGDAPAPSPAQLVKKQIERLRSAQRR